MARGYAVWIATAQSSSESKEVPTRVSDAPAPSPTTKLHTSGVKGGGGADGEGGGGDGEGGGGDGDDGGGDGEGGGGDGDGEIEVVTGMKYGRDRPP